jgi:hypothetical protein
MPSEWCYEELVELCKQKHKRDPTTYWNSLNWHDDLALFFAEKGREAWEDYARAGYSHNAFEKAVFSCEAYVVACVQSLHPMADLLAQIINAVIFKSPLEEKKVVVKEISNKLKKENAIVVKDSWDKFYHSYEFKYVSAFCNTIKHRRLIRTEGVRFSFVGQPSGNVFIQFEYIGQSYPETLGSSILNEYRKRVHELVVCTGMSITDYLRY